MKRGKFRTDTFAVVVFIYWMTCRGPRGPRYQVEFRKRSFFPPFELLSADLLTGYFPTTKMSNACIVSTLILVPSPSGTSCT